MRDRHPAAGSQQRAIVGMTAPFGRNAVIRQAISCDICGAEKRQTNHWFVAYEAGGELRISGWNARNRLRAGAKHLCGQTCLHKLADDFMARTIAVKAQQLVAKDQAESDSSATGARLTSKAGDADFESSARLITLAGASTQRSSLPSQNGLAAISTSKSGHGLAPPDEPPRFASRAWRAEAWEREREREQRAADCRPDIPAHRRRPLSC